MNFRRLGSILKKLVTKDPAWVLSRAKKEIKTPSFGITKCLMTKIKAAERRICHLFNGGKRSDDDFLTAVYDLNKDPMTFDFACFLVGAELFANKNGKKTFFVQFVRSTDEVETGPADDCNLDRSTIQWRFENIVIPLASLCPACVGYSVLRKKANFSEILKGKLVYPEFYDGSYTPNADYYREVFSTKEKFSGLRTPIEGIRHIKSWKEANNITNKIVTITLRQYSYDSIRNSNVDEWVKFAGLISEEGYTPVFVPDTHTCFERDQRLDPFLNFRDSCWNLGLRMALYEEAFLNFFVPNGPALLAQFNKKAKIIYMKYAVEGSLQSGRAVHEGLGLKVGQRKFGFSEEYQMLSWEDDTFENIREEFYGFLKDHS